MCVLSSRLKLIMHDKASIGIQVQPELENTPDVTWFGTNQDGPCIPCMPAA